MMEIVKNQGGLAMIGQAPRAILRVLAWQRSASATGESG